MEPGNSELAIVTSNDNVVSTSLKRHQRNWWILGVGMLVALTLLSVSICLPLLYVKASPKEKESRHISWPVPTPGEMAAYRFAAVTSDSAVCSDIGREILTMYGSAVDAAISTMLCIGVFHPQSAGIGGGSFMTVYDRQKNASIVYDYREEAPSSSTENMYAANSSLSTYGGLSTAVPGEIAGYHLAWERHGRLPWRTLFSRTIQLCKEGMKVHAILARSLASNQRLLGLNAPFRDEFFDQKQMSVLKEGDTLYRRRLAATLRRIADDPYSFYNGSLADDVVHDIQESGGIIGLNDLAEYRVKIRAPLRTTLQNGRFTMIYPPPPSSGVILSLLLNILDGYNFTTESTSSAQKDVKITTTTFHRIIEAFKFSYAKRSLLGDPEFVNISSILANLTSPDYAAQLQKKISDSYTHDIFYYEPAFYNRTTTGTSHVSVVDSLGNAVSTTSTINTSFGSKIMGSRTGIIFNNEMDDFSSPNLTNAFGYSPSESNFIRPKKRPMSSMCPSIVVDTKGDVRLLLGASGGSQIITASAWVAINHLYFGMTIKEAVDRPRMHHQLDPNYIQMESGIPQEYVTGLRDKGHEFLDMRDRAITNVIANANGALTAYGDFRKLGGTDGY